MPCEMDWLIKDRLVFQRCWGELTLDELRSTNHDFVDCIHAGMPLVHTIIDLTEVTDFPKSLTEINRAFARDEETLQRLGWTLVISTHPILRFFASIVTSLWNKARFRIFATNDEALNFLAELDATLDPAQVAHARTKMTALASDE